MKKVILLLLFCKLAVAQKTTMTKESFEPYTKILLVSQTELSDYRFKGLKKELEKYQKQVFYKNVESVELALEPDSLVFKKVIDKYKPEVMFIINMKEDKNNTYYSPPVITWIEGDEFLFTCIDVRTNKKLWKGLFNGFNPKKIVQKMVDDNLMVD